MHPYKTQIEPRDNGSGDLELEQFDFKRKRTYCQGEFIQHALEIAYDIFTVIISLLDVITDVMVLIHFYSTNRMTFFYISLTILIIAQLAYVMAFWWKFTGSTFNSASSALCACICLLPLSPILSYAFYFTSNDSTALYKFFDRLFNCECKMECCRSSTKTNRNNNQKNNKKHNALRKWVEDKLMKHLGFIIEALIEAFPQSILQLIAIVYYNDTHNYVSILSILLSMISVSTKSFILSVKVSYNWKSAVFNWIACLIDFIAIFCIVSLIFYVPSTEDNPFAMLQQIWLISTCITVIPFTLIGSTVLMCAYLFDDPECNFDWCVAFVLIVTLWVLGLALTTMLMTIAGFVVFALVLRHVGPSRRLLGHHHAPDLYMPLVSFINHAKSVHVSDYYEQETPLEISQVQHKTIRTCCINRVLIERRGLRSIYATDHSNTLLIYLKTRAVPSNNGVPYIHTSLEDIQREATHPTKRYANTCTKWWNLYENVPDYFYSEFDELNDRNVCSIASLYCFLPLYFVGRCFNTLFIFFMICYLYFGYDINVFTNDVPTFQTVMVCCYLGLVGVWIMLLFVVLKEQHYLSFILPAENNLKAVDEDTNTETTMQIMNYYHSVISQLVVQRYCVQIFGKDIAMIIMELWGNGNYRFYDKLSISKDAPCDSASFLPI
eukprot:382370_1